LPKVQLHTSVFFAAAAAVLSNSIAAAASTSRGEESGQTRPLKKFGQAEETEEVEEVHGPLLLTKSRRQPSRIVDDNIIDAVDHCSTAAAAAAATAAAARYTDGAGFVLVVVVDSSHPYYTSSTPRLPPR